ncbi:3'-5' exonuclease [Chelatococcus sp. YT9]|uniref:3'-5' exonuclease n=1 Tax=Chelatococcus sp. YT9 TaxID=2835635 RepID=UPI001BD0D072|nr:3'-5' exonuclease [Chelatococcus sp. YT9]MBS7701337.1 3'-5' exonuclease [Chelatococcus sp. YT9]
MASAHQPNFFALLEVEIDALGTEAREKPRRKARTKAGGPVPLPGRLPVVAYDAQQEAWASELEQSGRYRILRQLRFRPVVSRAPLPDEKVAVIVDVETTGLDHTKDEVIELGMVAVTYRDDGSFGDVIATFSELREPSIPISAESVRITGITPEMVAGKVLDLDAITQFIEPASLIIAHNARFDRPFCEKLARGFDVKAWACSASEIDWASFGFEGVKLGYLVGQSGWFHNGHRAVDDCHALLEVLGAPLKDGRGPAFSRLLASARRARYRIWAEYSPFDMKDVLKGRGYRWNDGSDGRPKSWWVETSDEALQAELQFLRTDIYQRDADPRVDRITAFERFKSAR